MSDIKLVNVIPIVNGWKAVSQKNKAEAQTLMASGNPQDYISGGIKDTAADLIAGLAEDLLKAPGIDPESLRPVAHWEEIPGSYKDHVGKDGSWFVPATRCTNPECREINPCSLKTPFCPMCGAKMEDATND